MTLQQQMEAIIQAFCPEGHKSEIVVRRDKIAGGGLLMDVQNAKDELGYEPVYDVVRLFENYKEEMRLDRFAELRNR